MKKAQKFVPGIVKADDIPELVGQIMDLFEDFLEEKGIVIDNPEIQEAIDDGSDPESLAILYGSDYSSIADGVEETLCAWNLIPNRWE